jgi:hypothetical protein
VTGHNGDGGPVAETAAQIAAKQISRQDIGPDAQCADPTTCRCLPSINRPRREGVQERARFAQQHREAQWRRYLRWEAVAQRREPGAGRCLPCGALGVEQLASYAARDTCPCRDGIAS